MEEQTSLVRVRYFSETNQKLSDREYTYFSDDRLQVGDVVTVPVRDTTGKAKVTAVDVPEAEIASFRDAVKTIPSGSVITHVGEATVELPTDYAATRESIVGRLSLSEESDGKVVGGLSMNDPYAASTEINDTDMALSEEDLEAPMTEALVKINPGVDEYVIGYRQQAEGLLAYAESRVIASPEDDADATNDLAIIAKLKQALEGKRVEYLEPLRSHTQAINEVFKAISEPIEKADKTTRAKMLAWRADLKRRQEAEEAINRKRREAAEEEMELKGELTESVEELPLTETTTLTRSTLGTSGQRDNWKYRIVDESLIPREYMKPDDAALKAAAKRKGQKQIPGVEFYNDPVMSVRSK